MRAKDLTALAGTLLCAALAAMAGAQPSPQSLQNSSARAPSPAQQQSAPQLQGAPQNPSPQPGHAVKVKTRVITVDVVATDSHGNIVRDLKPEELQISDNGPQKIAHFAFVDKSANIAEANPGDRPRTKGVYSNQASLEHMTIPPTVLLVDVLNTTIEAQATARKQTVRLMNMLPQNAPVAILLLRERLTVLQDFTTDSALLHVALDKAVSQSPLLVEDPQGDPNSPSNEYLRNAGAPERMAVSGLQDADAAHYALTMNMRVDTTAAALEEIAGYLRGYPGRKNLIWLSSSFPLTFFPRIFVAGRQQLGDPLKRVDYDDAVRKAASALSDAQVAVNPVDPEGLARGMIQPTMTGPNTKMAETTMLKLAEDTGGKACVNTNDLSGCVATSLKDSASYYELAYYPENVKWDGSFHAISMKTSRSGVALSYRRGYYAVDQEALAKQLPPEKQLQQACQDLLPSSAIAIAARAVSQDKAGKFRFLIDLPAGALDAGAESPHTLSARIAVCEFGPKDGTFRFSMRDLSRNISDAAYQISQTRGFEKFIDVAPAPGARRVRLAILDEHTGLTGAVDVPMPPEIVTVALPSRFAPTPESSQSSPVTSIHFSVPSGKSATLDWTGDKLVYQGDLGADETAPTFFHDNFMTGFRCDSGKLIPRDSSSGATPNLHFTFTNPSGQTATVDLRGTEPEYSGTLPVDPNAGAFFLRLWYLCHCTSP